MIKTRSFFHTKFFWILFAILSAGCGVFSYKFFPKAFPLLEIDIKMDRSEALTHAGRLAAKYGWPVDGYSRAASFELDGEAKNFIELEAGGITKLNEILEKKTYQFYTWHVRIFKEYETETTTVVFTPEGTPWNFFQELPESQPGAALTSAEAQKIAEQSAQNDWHVPINDYVLVERSQETRSGKRIDHSFTYEHSTRTFGDAAYRLKLVVSGNKLTQLNDYINIPEAFKRRYQEMRSANNIIALIAILLMYILFIVGGALCLFLLVGKQYIIWRLPLIFGTLTGILAFLQGINQWPLSWMYYNTALSFGNFSMNMILSLVQGALLQAALYTVVFAAAETLTRAAFGNHIQLWRTWSRNAAPTWQIFDRTIGGYLLVSIKLSFTLLFYFFSSKILHWWSPADTLFDPNILATYLPWLSPLVSSFQAGFTEECIFRAIPISCAALIGTRLGKRRIWIVAAVLLQALIFGAAHANYPTQPAYARIIEMFIPAVLYGWIYVRFGLLTGVITHYIFDAILFAIPLFIAQGHYALIYKAFILLGILVPLLVVLVRYWQQGSLRQLAAEFYNKAWQVPHATGARTEKKDIIHDPRSVKKQIPLYITCGVVGAVLWGMYTRFSQDGFALPVTRQEAITQAHRLFEKVTHGQTAAWTTISTLTTPLTDQHRFAWNTTDKKTWHQLMQEGYVYPMRWRVRYAQFEGDLVERANEWFFVVNKDTEITRVRHQLPESAPGANLSREQARAKAHETLANEFQLSPLQVEEMSAVASKKPARSDWTFIFKNKNTFGMTQGYPQITIEISGAGVTDYYPSLFIPQEWQRTETHQRSMENNIKTICMILLVILTVLGGFVIGRRFGFLFICLKTYLCFAILLIVIGAIQGYNNWPALFYLFNTSEPYSTQLLKFVSVLTLSSFFSALGIAYIAAYVTRIVQKQKHHIHTFTALIASAGIALLFSGINGCLGRFLPQITPLFADFTPAQSYIPSVSVVLGSLGAFMAQTYIILFIYVLFDYVTSILRLSIVPLAALSCVAGILLVGLKTTDPISFWLVSGIFTGIFLFCAYLLLVRYDKSTVPLMVGVTSCLAIGQQMAFNAYPGVMVSGTISIIVVLIAAFVWRWNMCMKSCN